MKLLEVNDLYVSYGDVPVLHGVTLSVEEGEIVTIVGANGAGKTTLLKTVSGFLKPTQGEILFLGEKISYLYPHKIVEKGLVCIPEGRKIFPTLSVLENLQLGAYISRAKLRRAENLEKVFSMFPILRERSEQLAGTLSGGEQQMLAIARGLMAMPRLLMLDEPSLGLAPKVVMEIFNVVREMNKEGTTILLVEQNVFGALELSNRGYVLENGRIFLEGKSSDLLKNEHIREAYLGI
jgi:branched-chain amino acid transport system ATP-binding protein